MKASRGRIAAAAAVHPLASVEGSVRGWPQSTGVLCAVLHPNDACEHSPSLHTMRDWLINCKWFLISSPRHMVFSSG